MQIAGAQLECWISEGGFFPYQVDLGWSDAPTAPAAPDFSNPPALLWLAASLELWRARYQTAACLIAVDGDPVTRQAGALTARQKSWSPGPVAEHGVGAGGDCKPVCQVLFLTTMSKGL